MARTVRGTTLLAAIAGLFVANIATTACGTDTITQPSPRQTFGSSPPLVQRPTVYGFFIDTSSTANAVIDDLAALGAKVIVVPLSDDFGIAAARRATGGGMAGYLGLVLPTTTPDDDAGEAGADVAAPSCDELVAAATARFDVLADAAADLRQFYLPADIAVSARENFATGCGPDAAATIAHHIREAGASATSIAIAPEIDIGAAPCDDVCVDDVTATWTTYLQNAQIDVVMLNDGVLGKGIDPAVARTYFAPLAKACANANATFFVSAESYVGTNRAAASDFFGRLDYYANAGIDAEVVTRTVSVDASWICADDAGCNDDLGLCQASRLSGSACP